MKKLPALGLVAAFSPLAHMEGQRIWLELDPGRHDAGRWTCSSEIAARYLPAVCRP